MGTRSAPGCTPSDRQSQVSSISGHFSLNQNEAQMFLCYASNVTTDQMLAKHQKKGKINYNNFCVQSDLSLPAFLFVIPRMVLMLRVIIIYMLMFYLTPFSPLFFFYLPDHIKERISQILWKICKSLFISICSSLNLNLSCVCKEYNLILYIGMRR